MVKVCTCRTVLVQAAETEIFCIDQYSYQHFSAPHSSQRLPSQGVHYLFLFSKENNLDSIAYQSLNLLPLFFGCCCIEDSFVPLSIMLNNVNGTLESESKYVSSAQQLATKWHYFWSEPDLTTLGVILKSPVS